MMPARLAADRRGELREGWAGKKIKPLVREEEGEAQVRLEEGEEEEEEAEGG